MSSSLGAYKELVLCVVLEHILNTLLWWKSLEGALPFHWRTTIIAVTILKILRALGFRRWSFLSLQNAFILIASE